MKKIKKMKQLKAEQKILLHRESQLESTIRSDWKELKESLKPVNIAKEAFSKWMNKQPTLKPNGRTLLASGLSVGTALLAKKLFGKAGKIL